MSQPFAEEAQRRSRTFKGAGDGAKLAADSIETLLSSSGHDAQTSMSY